ncbi:helix-turn-helix transcriptional regulator [Paenibacillus glycanilyticus]|uniref:CBS domain-containing protein n=1 Tax=Paenibacillus glycanilyticus TaxID=126569 RepID=UPI00203F844A|nr:CBS domain-containing protein [Paenibacillus glycanilyticus]MCM3628759.1 helix-turn-helix transcriptional regulator [Paenibacillus glycanilyticus]
MLELVKKHAPITGEQLAEYMGVSRPTLRSDLSLLVMLNLLDAKPKVGYFLGETYRSTDDTAARQRFDNIKVHEIQGVPINIPETLSVQDAVITLFTENANTLLIVNENKNLAGIVTPKDLLKITLGNAGAGAIPVSMVMTRYPNIVTLVPEESVSDAIRKMMLHQVDCLPVIIPGDGGPEISGWVSKSNIIRLMSDIATAAELGD